MELSHNPKVAITMIPILQGWRLRHKRLLLAQDPTVVSGGAGSLTLDGALHTAPYLSPVVWPQSGLCMREGLGLPKLECKPHEHGALSVLAHHCIPVSGTQHIFNECSSS